MKLATKQPDRNERLLDGMALIRQAIVEEQQICFRYRKNKQGLSDLEETIRQTNPYGLVFTNGDWMLIAFCHLRQEIRHFLLRRMSEIQLLEKTFNRPAEFNLHTYTPPDDRDVIVIVLVHPHLANKVKEYNYYYMDSIDERQEGLYITLRVRRPEDALQWLLSWGAGVVVLEPESLRRKIKEEAKKY